jgi:hypothetical protein
MSGPTFLVEWRDGDIDPEGDDLHSIEHGTPADVLGILAAVMDGNAWDVSILQNDAEEAEKAA